MSSSKQRNEIAIIGIACWYPGAKNILELWENILSRRRQFRRIQDVRLPLSDYFHPDPRVPDKTYGDQAALIDGYEYDWLGNRVPKSTFESTDIVHWLAVDVAMEALKDAGFDKVTIPKEKTGILLGNTLTGEFTRSTGFRMRWPYVAKTLHKTAQSLNLPSEFTSTFERYMEECFKSPFPNVTEDTLAGGLSNTIAGRICNYLDLKGGGYTVDGACSSSLLALCRAADCLVNRDLDLAFAGGVDISLDTFEMIGFAKTGALTPDEMKVYDKNGKGFIPGEGCGFVVLKRLEDAITDGNYIYAVIKGWGISSDGRGGITAPNSLGQSLALRRAYEKAGYHPREVDFIEGHGTGTSVGDPIEVEAIVLADNSKTDGIEISNITKKKGLTSIKSIIGHTKAAAGIAGLIKAIMAVNRRIIPPTAGITQPHPIFSDKGKNLYPIMLGEICDPKSKLRAGVSAMGFGGINTHVTLESGDAPAPKLKTTVDERSLLVSNQETELFLLAGENESEVIQLAKNLAEIAKDISLAELADFSYATIQQINVHHKMRAAIVATKPRDLVERLGQLQKMLSDNSITEGKIQYSPFKEIWIGNRTKKNRVGYLCSGQGAQQINMARALVERHPWAREIMTNANAWVGEIDDRLLKEYVYLPTDQADAQQLTEWKRMLTNTHVAQPAICLTSLLWSKKLEQLGIIPVAVGGHSLGELTAFYLAGAINEKELVKLAALRGEAMSASSDQAGTMVSLGCDVKTVLEINQNIEGYWTVANINSPSQTVIAGEKATLQEILKRAKIKGIQAVELPVSNAFHSRFVHHSADILKEKVRIPDKYSGGEIKLFSCMDGNQVQTGTVLKDHFAQQIITQVNFIALVESIAKECDLIIEVGIGSILSNLVKSIVDEQQILCLPVESKPGIDRDLNTIIAAYFVHGGDIQVEALFENRLIRPFINPSDRKFIVNPCENEQRIASLEGKKVSLSLGHHSGIFEDLGIPQEVLAKYLSQRSQFIKDIIKTDIKHLENIDVDKLTAISVVGDQEQSAAIEIEAETKPEPQKSEPADLKSDVENRIIELISEKTGFPVASLSPEMYLLNDLNMESIKAGELIVNVAREYEVAGLVDPAPLAQATIHDVASAIVVAKEGLGGGVSGMSNIQRLLNNIEKSSGTKTWVRDFIIQPEIQPITLNAQHQAFAHKVLILHEDNDIKLVEQISHKFKAKGSEIQSRAYQTVDEPFASDFSMVIGILPRKSDNHVNRDRIMAAVERLHLIARTGLSQKPATDENGEPAKQFLMTIQFSNGKFGAENKAAAFDQAGTTSFMASIHHEKPHLLVRSLDFAPTLADEKIAPCIIDEIQTDDRYVIAGYDENLVRFIPRPILQNPSQYVQRKIQWSTSDVILVPGGARGITAQCAFEIAQQTGAKMALIGSSPLPQIEQTGNGKHEILQTLDKYHSANLTCKYYQCDISDAEIVNETIKVIEGELGLITGVIFGAGINNPRFVEAVSLEDAQKDIAPKVIGALNICNALDKKPPKIFIGLSSIIGITGMPGNAWYAFSNEILDLMLRQFQSQHPETAVLCLAYSIWDEVGMGARMGSVQILASMGTSAIPVQEGIQRFVRLFFNDPGNKQVIVTARLGGLDTWNLKAGKKPDANKFIENIELFIPGIEAVSKVHLNLEAHSFLRDHNYEGSYLFPAVFGLESMAQTVALVTGRTSFSSVSLTHINFDRPIIADTQHGTDILIHAVVAEPDSDDQIIKVQVGIAAEQSGFAYNHFSAVFQIPTATELKVRPVDCKRDTNGPLHINPKTDLYGRLLFQGPSFQRLQEFYALSTVYTECSSMIQKYQSNGENGEAYLLGDPYFRDSILQTGQVVAGRDKALPRSIDRIDIYPVSSTEKEAVIIAELIERTDEHWLSIFTVMDKSGVMMEKLNRCEFTILETIAEEPTCEEMAFPDKRDNGLLQQSISQLAQEFGVKFPMAKISNLPDLHSLKSIARRKRVMPLLDQAIADYLVASNLNDSPDNYKIKWLQTGKPQVKMNNSETVQLSLSHDDRFCLATASSSDLGCDIMLIDEKPAEEWKALLGPKHNDLFEKLSAQEDKSYAGSRIWAAREAAFKAQNTNDMELSLANASGKAAIFACRTNGNQCRVITFPLFFTLGRERMLAFVLEVEKIETKEVNLTKTNDVNLNLFKPNSGKQREELLREFGYDPQTFMMDADIDEETMSLVIRWPLTLREAANLSRGIYFSTYGEWLGMVRELGIQPINDRLLPQLATGKWGLVTNESEIEILGDWLTNDTIQVRLWIMPDDQMPDSSLQLYYDWQKVTPQGNYERLAFGYLRASFVEIMGHGEVKVIQLPDYFQQFIQRMKRPAHSVKKLDKIPERLRNLALGKLLYQKPDGPVRGPLLHEKIFETSLLESNMVGNIYFSNYYKWQGSVRDSYFYQLLPAHYQQTYVNTDLRCLKTRIDHLRDTMPFARIMVRMYLNRLYENGCQLDFEYYQQFPNGQEIKLAYGTHQAVWIDSSDPQAPRSVSSPEPILKSLLAACGR